MALVLALVFDYFKTQTGYDLFCFYSVEAFDLKKNVLSISKSAF